MENLGTDRLGHLRATLREVLAQAARWQELPALLDEIDAVRGLARPARRVDVSPGHGDVATFWIHSFADELTHHAAVNSDAARRAARELMPWLGDYDPVALARGSWVDLPKSYG